MTPRSSYTAHSLTSANTSNCKTAQSFPAVPSQVSPACVHEPDEPFRRLTLAIAARWPAFPPYGGKHAQVTPHLSLLESADCVPFDELERDAAAQLPLQAPAREAQLIAFDGDRYHVVHRLSLG